MALKDWKRINHMGIPMWENEKKDIILGIREPKTFNTKSYEIYLGGKKSMEIGKAKTKTLAIKKAKSYMRSH